MKILIINGPNLNMLGSRDPDKYGKLTLRQINEELLSIAAKVKVELDFFQSNHEGDIVDFLQNDSSREAAAVLINPGALTHYGYSIRDALADLNLPVVEVHLSAIMSREDFRKIDVLDGLAIKKISGLKENSYFEGLKFLINLLKK